MSNASLRQLKFCNFKLDKLLEITEAINNNLPIAGLLNKYEEILTKDLNIGKVILYSYNKRWRILLAYGVQDDSYSDIDVERDLVPYNDITTTTTTTNEQLRAFSLVIPVFQHTTPIAYILIGDLDEEQTGISPTIKHLHFVQTFTNIIIVAIENKRLLQAEIRQEAMRKELELASKMQSMLIPSKDSFPQYDNVLFDSKYLPHYEVGGDYYDVIHLNTHEVGFCVSDVSGKGISGALLMSNFQANLRALFTPDISLSNLVVRLNEIVLNNTKGDRFITLFIAKYNRQTKILTYINAGHNPPVYYELGQPSISYLKSGTVGLAMLDELPFLSEGCLHIKNPTRMLCYTDGLVEIEDHQRIEIGRESIERNMFHGNSISDVINLLSKELNITKENNLIFDDIAMLGIDFI